MKRYAHLNDLAAAVGAELATSDWITIDQARIDQFAQATLHQAPDQRAAGENLHGLNDLPDALGRTIDVELSDVIEEAIEVLEDLGGQLDAGHRADQRAAFRAAGLRGR